MSARGDKVSTPAASGPRAGIATSSVPNAERSELAGATLARAVLQSLSHATDPEDRAHCGAPYVLCTFSREVSVSSGLECCLHPCVAQVLPMGPLAGLQARRAGRRRYYAALSREDEKEIAELTACAALMGWMLHRVEDDGGAEELIAACGPHVVRFGSRGAVGAWLESQESARA